MDRFPPAREAPRREMQMIGRELAELPLEAEEISPRDYEALVFTLVAIVALLGFVGWLLVG